MVVGVVMNGIDQPLRIGNAEYREGEWRRGRSCKGGDKLYTLYSVRVYNGIMDKMELAQSMY